MGKFAITNFSALHAVMNILRVDIFQHIYQSLSHSVICIFIEFHWLGFHLHFSK